MNLNEICILVERLRKAAIGEPTKITEKQVFEYQDHSVKVVAILKLTRAVHGLSAMHLLCGSGLFIDFGSIVRCVNDCVEEVYFLLENFPAKSGHVDQFIKGFFESTIEGYLSNETPDVPRKKIRSAVVRVLKGRHDHITFKIIEEIHKTFCGYVHADYAHIMEVKAYPSASGNTKCCIRESGPMIERIANITASAACPDDRLSAFPDRVPAALRR